MCKGISDNNPQKASLQGGLVTFLQFSQPVRCQLNLLMASLAHAGFGHVLRALPSSYFVYIFICVFDNSPWTHSFLPLNFSFYASMPEK